MIRTVRLLGASLLLVAHLAACTGGSSDNLMAWAGDYCEVLGEWSEEREVPASATSPSSDFAGEQTALRAFGQGFVAASDDALGELRDLEHPREADEMHAAAITLIEQSSAAWNAVLAEIASASGSRDLEDAGWDLSDGLGRATYEYEFVQLAQSEPVIESIRSVRDCDALLVPAEPTVTTAIEADIDPEVESLLLAASDMRAGTWRVAEVGGAEFPDVSAPPRDCTATVQFDSDGTGSLIATLATEEPTARGMRLLFNGIIGNHGSQLWNEVWAFETEQAAEDTLTAMDRALEVDLKACLDNIFEGDEVTVTQPVFTLPNSAAYAFDVHDRFAPPDMDTHIGVHLVQRGRFIALAVFYDHDPARLWTVDGERLLTLLEERLTSAP